MRRAGALAVAAIVVAAALPAGAEAHSLVRPAGQLVSYLSEDATSLNTLTVRVSGGRIEFRDPTVDGGMDPGSCTPGDVTPDSNSWIIQTFCPQSGVRRVRIDLGEREDTATVALPMAATVIGGPGADRSRPARSAPSSPAATETISSGADRPTTCSSAARARRAERRRRGGPDRVAATAWRTACSGRGCGRCRRRHRRSGRGRLRDGRAHAHGGAEGVADDEPAARSRSARRRSRPSPARGVSRSYATSSKPGTIERLGLPQRGRAVAPGAGRGGDRRRGRGRDAHLPAAEERGRSRRAPRRAQGEFAARRRRDRPGRDTCRRRAPRIRLSRRSAVAGAPGLARHPEPNDVDGDEVMNEDDNCPTVKNGSQVNTDLGFTPTTRRPPRPSRRRPRRCRRRHGGRRLRQRRRRRRRIRRVRRAPDNCRIVANPGAGGRSQLP